MLDASCSTIDRVPWVCLPEVDVLRKYKRELQLKQIELKARSEDLKKMVCKESCCCASCVGLLGSRMVYASCL